MDGTFITEVKLYSLLWHVPYILVNIDQDEKK